MQQNFYFASERLISLIVLDKLVYLRYFTSHNLGLASNNKVLCLIGFNYVYQWHKHTTRDDYAWVESWAELWDYPAYFD